MEMSSHKTSDGKIKVSLERVRGGAQSNAHIEMGDKPRTELLGALQNLYVSRDYSDLVIFARDGSRHSVHKAIVCPRSQYLCEAVKEGRWREGNDGHIVLDDEPEVVRLLVEYLYLLDYEPVNVPTTEDGVSSHGDSSDTMSVRTEPGHYGNVYGTSAISAFGGPQSPFSAVYRNHAESQLTVHALPSGDYHGSFGSRPDSRRRKSSRGVVPSVLEPSPLATAEPHLTLHARMYTASQKYGIDGLKALALDKFKIQLTRHWDSHEFAEAIHVVYNSTSVTEKDMREAVADTLGWHNRLFDKPDIEIAIMEINGLAYELLKRARRAEPEYMS